ncbi:hypothetical protein SK128_027490 [Halocaridina rubra]|uniref:Caspase n=1 Tax=Halocaridina rubra TaxID=373956 RepID=A0AAN8WMW0_HALRR
MPSPEMTDQGPCKCPQSSWGEVPTAKLFHAYWGYNDVYYDWIQQGGDVNAGQCIGYNFLYAASAGNNPDLIKEILHHPEVHVNTVCKWKYTALMGAARWGHLDCVKILTSTVPVSNCRLDFNAKDYEGMTALAIAAKYKRWHILPYLLAPGVKYDSINLNISLCETAKAHQWNLVAHLLQKYQGFITHKLTHVLFLATESRQIKILQLLIQYHYEQCDIQSLKKARDWAAKIGYFEEEKLLTSVLDGYCPIPKPLKSNGVGPPYAVSLPITIKGFKTTDGRPLLTDPSPNSSPEMYSNRHSPPEEPIGRLNLNVIPVSTPVPPGPDTYDTTTLPRGIVLILNYNDFENRSDMLREGSYLDVLNLRDLSDQMGYETQAHYNLTREQTLDILNTFREQVRLQRVSCAIVAIMSHGISRHTFYTSDMNTVTVNEVQNLFFDNQCPYLKNKPKIFLFNFCRGFDIPATLETDLVREQPRNIMCIYSTTESFLSYRDRIRGSPFIRALCEVLANHAHEMDLDNLIRKFQQKYLPNTTPEIQNLGFYKKFFFNPMGPQRQIYQSW